MSIYATTPYMTPALVRANQYARPCAACGTVLRSGQGKAFLIWSQRRNRNMWKAVCDDTCLANFAAGRAEDVPAQSLPIGSLAAKAVADRHEAEALAERLAEAPAFQMPDAEQAAALLAQLVEQLSSTLVQDVAAQFTETVPPMVADLLSSARPVTITVNDLPSVQLDVKHKALEDVLLMVVAGTSPYLVGPAGSGKTTLAEQIAKVLGKPFYLASRVTSEYKLTGFVDAQGKTVRTAFREAYEHGGVFLFDEVDASDAEALNSFNAALAGQWADFPDGMVARHKDFVAIAAGNTFGRGADRQYVGRTQLDAATLDRFQVYEVDYDEQLEVRLAGNEEWTLWVQKVRRAVELERVRHVVSPRASVAGAKLLAAGMERSKVEEACIWKGLDATQRQRITHRMTAEG